MSDIKVIYEDEDWIEFEITQQNDLVGDTSLWNDEDWSTWKTKMEKIEQEGIKGQLEKFTIKFPKKADLINGAGFTRKISGDEQASK